MSVTFNASGTITIGTSPPITLRRPTFGEYRRARDKHRDNLSQVSDAIRQSEQIVRCLIRWTTGPPTSHWTRSFPARCWTIGGVSL